MTDYFSYNSSCDLPPDSFRIAPSQLSRFLDSTARWYRENLLGEAPEFEYSTASELGTVVHAIAHMYHDTGQADLAAIEAYISSLPDDVDKALIREQYPIMAETLINDFLRLHPGTDAELFTSTEILPGIYAAGTIDSYCSKSFRIRDFKTMGSLDTARLPSSFPRSYWFQQLAYAYILTQCGYRVDFVDLVYVTRSNVGRISPTTGKALKDYPSQVHVITEPITPDSFELISGVLKLVAHSVQHWNDHPEHRYLLAQDFRLYTPPKRALFT